MQTYFVATVSSCVLGFVGAFFGVMNAVMVSCLHNARGVNDFIHSHDVKTNMTVAEIKKAINNYVEKIGGETFLSGNNIDFLNHLEEVSQATLNPITKKRAIKLFDQFIDDLVENETKSSL